MNKYLIVLAFLVSLYSAQDTLFYSDEFETFDFHVWEHESTMHGENRGEFQWFVNNRSNSYVKEGVLYLLPTLTENAIGLALTKSSAINIWGSTPADLCTSNEADGCKRNTSMTGDIQTPIRSPRIRTKTGIKYGRVEIKAKMPRGDWIRAGISMLPLYNEFGVWPASGEIDIAKSRGNRANYSAGGIDMFTAGLHWGPDNRHDGFSYTYKTYEHDAGLDEDFHIYGVYWDADRLYTYFDDESNIVLDVDFSTPLFPRANYPTYMANPYAYESENSAPFNREFGLVLKVAVGGTNGYFPDTTLPKPWKDTSPRPKTEFYNAKNQWYSTWEGENAAMQIESINVWTFE